jgi:UDP-N-acetylmuramoyl-L-alanyl-D-glutamate--2,6-diaminopimelate ligase
MQFAQLLRQAGIAPLAQEGQAEVSAVCADSRQAGPGSCFVAIRGPLADGHDHIASAVAAGATVVVCQEASRAPAGVARAVVADSASAAGPLAQAILGWPSRRLTNIAVTGTKGKSTVTYMVRSILEQDGRPTGLLGTISYQTGRRSVPAGNTTPGAVELAGLCHEMVAAGMTHLVMETSSHALHQGRTAGIDFAAGVFTNLSGEHMDYHRTMHEYLDAKAILFERLGESAAAVVNADDPAGREIARRTRARLCRYGLGDDVDLRGRIESLEPTGTWFVMDWAGCRQRVFTPLIGRHNVYNGLAAAGACLALGVDLETAARGLEALRRVPGRMERVGGEGCFQVFVDYAHTDDALQKALESLAPLRRGRVILVFGCGGDRDRTKRPRMARVAQRLADRIVVTSDNPRTEDPLAIIDQIVSGLDADGRSRTTIEPDRRRAIELAIDAAQAGDIVLIAGKGHENYQIIGTARIGFDDVEVAQECLRQREGVA